MPMSRIWALQKDEWVLLTLGCIGAIGGGTIQPIFSLVYAGIIATYFMPDDKSIRCGFGVCGAGALHPTPQALNSAPKPRTGGS